MSSRAVPARPVRPRACPLRRLGLALVAAAVWLTGCGLQRGAALSVHGRNSGDPTVLGHVERAIEAGEQALDNLDTRLENTIW